MIHPLNQFVAIRPEKPEQGITDSGIVFSSKPVEKDRATVIAVSEEVDTVKVGDTILVHRYGKDPLKVGEEEVVFIEVSDIYAIITEE